MTSSTHQTELQVFIQQTENYLDMVVETGNDQQLFIASYLQGHFAVQAGQSQVQNMQYKEDLNQLMQTSLHQAFVNNELEALEQKQVSELWELLLQGENSR